MIWTHLAQVHLKVLLPQRLLLQVTTHRDCFYSMRLFPSPCPLIPPLPRPGQQVSPSWASAIHREASGEWEVCPLPQVSLSSARGELSLTPVSLVQSRLSPLIKHCSYFSGAPTSWGSIAPCIWAPGLLMCLGLNCSPRNLQTQSFHFSASWISLDQTRSPPPTRGCKSHLVVLQPPLQLRHGHMTSSWSKDIGKILLSTKTGSWMETLLFSGQKFASRGSV